MFSMSGSAWVQVSSKLKEHDMSIFTKFFKDESGASAIEYSLLAAMMASAIVAATTTFSADLGSAFKNIGARLTANTKI